MATEYTQEMTIHRGIMCSITNRKLWSKKKEEGEEGEDKEEEHEEEEDELSLSTLSLKSNHKR